MNYANIKYPDVSNGPGVRVSLFVSGCRLNCPGCFNKEAQCFSYGKQYDETVKEEILDLLNNPWVKGLSLLGGDPMEPENQSDILDLVLTAKEKFPDKDIWLWTGRIYPDLPMVEGVTKKLINNIDVLIDGPFIESEKDLTLEWRGSRNQRVIDLRKFDN